MRLIRQHVDCIKKKVQTICLDTWHFMHEIGADPYGLMVTVFSNTTTCKSVSPTLTHTHTTIVLFLFLWLMIQLVFWRQFLFAAATYEQRQTNS